jgi:hypothetical protein
LEYKQLRKLQPFSISFLHSFSKTSKNEISRCLAIEPILVYGSEGGVSFIDRRRSVDEISGKRKALKTFSFVQRKVV